MSGDEVIASDVKWSCGICRVLGDETTGTGSKSMFEHLATLASIPLSVEITDTTFSIQTLNE